MYVNKGLQPFLHLKMAVFRLFWPAGWVSWAFCKPKRAKLLTWKLTFGLLWLIEAGFACCRLLAHFPYGFDGSREACGAIGRAVASAHAISFLCVGRPADGQRQCLHAYGRDGQVKKRSGFLAHKLANIALVSRKNHHQTVVAFRAARDQRPAGAGKVQRLPSADAVVAV
jgi:hypothetical protein